MSVLKCGKVPRHIAFIMDGNRRYANKCHLERINGHALGFDKLAQTLEWCNQLGIQEVTVYALSIDNLKRTQDEVDSLMRLARDKFQRLRQESDKLKEKGVCVRVFGDISLLPQDIQRSIAEIVLSTRHHDKAFLNVCFAYTSTQEMTLAINQLSKAVASGLLDESDVTQSLLSDSLFTSRSSHPDLLIRTSGEVRLSDFLLWQSGLSVLAFETVLWPEFTIWHLFSAVFYYQRHHLGVNEAIENQKERERGEERGKESGLKKREEFLEQLELNRVRYLESILN